MMEFVKHLEGLASSHFKIAKGILSIFKLEARLAKSSIAPLIASLFVLFIILLSSWLSLMVLGGYILTLTLHNILYTLLIIFIFHLFLLLLLGRFLLITIRRMSFEKTRECLSYQSGSLRNELKKTTD